MTKLQRLLLAIIIVCVVGLILTLASSYPVFGQSLLAAIGFAFLVAIVYSVLAEWERS